MEILKFFQKIIRTFFYRGEDFQPPYFWITLFCGLVAIAVIFKIYGVNLSDSLILGMLGFILGWAAVYNWNTKNQ